MQYVLRFGVLFALVLSGVACSDGDDEDTTGDSDRESSSGSERSRSSKNRNSKNRNSSKNRNRSNRTADSNGENGGDQETGTGTVEPGNSPWGETRAEQCRPPTRREVNTQAQNAIDGGVRAARNGDSDRAQTEFERAISADSNAFAAAYNLGVLADRSGNEGRALEMYRRALSIQPDYEKALEGIATISIRRGQVADAVSTVEPIARQYPTNLHLQALYAEMLVRAQRYDDAWTAARSALRCDERFVPALIAIIKASLGQGRETLAERVLEQALEVDTNNAELHYLNAQFLLQATGRLNDALNELRRAVELRPDYIEARTALGIQLLAGANYTEALQNFQAAAQLAPNIAAVHVGLGNAYRAHEQWAAAKTEFDRALQLDANLAEVHFNLGLLYMAAGANFPGSDEVTSLQRAIDSFTRYRNMMGSRLPREDESEGYLRSLNRQLEREQRRIERERAAAQSGGDQ